MVRFGKTIRMNGGVSPQRSKQDDTGQAGQVVPASQEPLKLRAADLFRARAVLNRAREDQTLLEIPSPVPLAKGELCHHAVEASLCLAQDDGIKYLDYGTLVFTDRRLIFHGAAMTVKTGLRDIINLTIAGAGGVEVQSRSRRRREIYATAFPVECLAYLVLVFQTHGKTPPLSEELARELLSHSDN